MFVNAKPLKKDDVLIVKKETADDTQKKDEQDKPQQKGKTKSK